MMRRPLTKQGRYGTLTRYRCTYHDDLPPGEPQHHTPSTWGVWAYSREHAAQLFDETSEGQGFSLLAIERVMVS